MSTTLAAPPSTQDLKLSYRFRAPREKVFAAFSTIEVVKQWFGPPTCQIGDGMMDFRVGGRYRFVVAGTEGKVAVSGEFLEITPPEKICYSWKWEDDEDWVDVDSTVTFEFHAHGNETEMHMTHVGFPNEESRGKHGEGWQGSFVKLDAYVGA